MAAVLSPSPSFAPGPQTGRRPSARPALRLVQGGRSAVVMAPVYRRRRVIAALVLVTLLVVGWQVAQAAASVAGGWAAPVPATIDGPTVVVEADTGDTLWTLARDVQPTGDVRPAVEAMLAERGDARLEVGDRVRVPVG
ncbi:MAG: hypothetical protein ACR2JF_08815 [Iamia sp.]